MPRRRCSLSGIIKESHFASDGRGLIHIQKGEGGNNNGGDRSLNFGGALKVKERRRDEAARVI